MTVVIADQRDRSDLLDVLDWLYTFHNHLTL
jgi:hypothetical protein